MFKLWLVFIESRCGRNKKIGSGFSYRREAYPTTHHHPSGGEERPDLVAWKSRAPELCPNVATSKQHHTSYTKIEGITNQPPFSPRSVRACGCAHMCVCACVCVYQSVCPHIENLLRGEKDASKGPLRLSRKKVSMGVSFDAERWWCSRSGRRGRGCGAARMELLLSWLSISSSIFTGPVIPTLHGQLDPTSIHASLSTCL